jgi:hypothetical protein
MIKIKTSIFITVLFFVFISQASAQSFTTDSSFYKEAIRNTTVFYRKQIASQSLLYNGKLYYPAVNDIKGHPYLLSDTIFTGSIVFDHVLYEDVQLQYDILNDDVIVVYPGQGIKLKLNKYKVGSIKINNRLFINSSLDEENSKKNTDVGFYEILYSKKIKVLAKRKKLINSIVTQDGRNSSYKEQTSYYILFENNLYPIKNMRSVYKIFPKRKSELRALYNSNKIGSTGFEQTLIKTIESFDK